MPALPQSVTKNVVAQPTASKFDLSGTAIGNLLGLLNNPGTVVGATPGYSVSNAGARAASTAAYNQQVANAQKVYGEAQGLVTARNPGIQQAYDQGTAAIQAQARARAIADTGRMSALAGQAQQAQGSLGLEGVATPATSATNRTAATDAAQEAKVNANADSWAGYNTGAAQRAVASNNAVGDAFAWQGAQQQAALAGLLQQALAKEQDSYHAGSSGKVVGALTPAQQISLNGKLLDFSSTDFNNDLKASKAKSAAKSTKLANTLKVSAAKAKGLYG